MAVSNRNEEYFNMKIKEVENFIIKNKKKPTKKTNKALALWISGRVRDSNSNETQKQKVRDLLEENGLLGRVGKTRRSWNEIFSLFKKYIEENGTDEMSKEKSEEIFGIDIKFWINQSRLKKEKRIVLENLYIKNNIPFLRRNGNFTNECTLLFNFSHESKIHPFFFLNYQIGKQSFPTWFNTTKSYYNRKKLSKKKIDILGYDKLNDLCCNDYYFDIEQLKIFNKINKDIDIEIKNIKFSPYLVIKKEKTNDYVSYEVTREFVETKKSEEILKVEDMKDMKDISFVLGIDIRNIITKLRKVSDSLDQESQDIVKKYDKCNLNLQPREYRFKHLLLKKIGQPYYYNDYKDIINILWDESSIEYNKTNKKSNKKNSIVKLLKNHTKTLEEMGNKVGFSRERVRQVSEEIFSIFKEKIENNISIIENPIYENSKKEIIYYIDEVKEEEIEEEIEDVKEIDNKQEEDQMSLKNKIYFGAPGTGKSHKVQEIIGKEKNLICMFHEEYSYFDFLGQYKPVMYKIDNGNRNTKTYNEKNELVEMYNEREPLIVYDFIPGIFLKAYLEAKKTDEKVFLIIEEINRGDCSAIFGDLFQLLDRNDRGESKYSINTSNEVAGFLKNNGVENYNELKIPSNLHIISTMNTSDQSLFNMDSAFKRRWDMFFVEINYNEKVLLDVKIENTDIKWLTFLEKINDLITETLENENKCLGQWFIKPQNNIISESQFKNKIIHYLYFDVFHNERQEIFKELKYSNIIKKEINEIIKNILDDDDE